MSKAESDETKIAVLVEKVGTMNLTLTKMDTKIDILNANAYPKDQGVTLEKKVESLEDWKNRMLGALVVINVVWGSVIFFITGHKP